MAEVPEVEILVRDMAALVGRSFVGATVLVPDTIRYPSAEAFADALAGREILRAHRRAKYMLLDLSGGGLLAMHCSLHGTLRLMDAGAPPFADAVLTMTLDDGRLLVFRDEMGYARAAAGPAGVVTEQLKLDELGPDLLDETFEAAQLATIFAGRRGALKNLLINQRILAGLGNRDADESLWLAQIDPQRQPRSLTDDEIGRLLPATRAVLAEGLDARGTMTDLWGVRGTARHRRNVYGQYGAPCPRCGAKIARVKLGAQMTYFCPGCQR